MSLISLPADILRRMAVEHLSFHELFILCQSSLFLSQCLYTPITFWLYIQEYLTNNPDIIASLKSSNVHPRNILSEFYTEEPLFVDQITNEHVVYTRLGLAASKGYMQYILNHWNDYDFGADIDCLLYAAASSGHLDIYSYLAKHHPGDRCNDIAPAATSGNLELVKFIDDFCVCANHERLRKYQRALGEVFSSDNAISNEVIDYLISKGARLDIDESYFDRDEFMTTPMTSALRNSVTHIKYLMERGVPLLRGSLHAVFDDNSSMEYDDMVAVVKYLVEELGCTLDDNEPCNNPLFAGDPQFRDDPRRTIVPPQVVPHCYYTPTFHPKYLNIVPYLHDHGALPANSVYILAIAIADENEDIARYLIERGTPIPLNYVGPIAYNRTYDANKYLLAYPHSNRTDILVYV